MRWISWKAFRREDIHVSRAFVLTQFSEYLYLLTSRQTTRSDYYAIAYLNKRLSSPRHGGRWRQRISDNHSLYVF